MKARVKKMTDERLEERRQRDVDSGAMQYGETAASREQRSRESDGAASITVDSSKYFLTTCKLTKITCGECGENLRGKKSYLSMEADSYCQECGEKLGL